ncbi:hypothetical protein [Winogradskyella sp. A3E31]|uniref:hypothetical protein n=1 Tax=Winogradskyella sp. A3E31 TaxID=3349637 RepID=UPI00398B3C0C
MKTLKHILGLTLIGLLSFTSCQKEEDNTFGDEPNTNGVDSVTKSNLERSSMFDGSFDDFLDGNACTSVLLPVTAVVNGTQVTVISESDLDIVLDILGEFNTDDDQVILQFPLTVMTSNYTEVVVNSQGEYDALIDACEEAEAAGEDAISCLDVEFPMTILTYNINAEQTGSVVFESEEQLFTYMSNLGNDELFSVNYPISVEFSNGTTASIDGDSELQASIDDCTFTEDEMDEAEENADALEEILVDGMFRVESFINTGVDTANDYVEFTIDFSNDLTVRAENNVNALIEDVEGTYEVTSETEVFLSLQFENSASFELLNQTWEVTSFSSTSIELVSTTDAAVTLVLTQI